MSTDSARYAQQSDPELNRHFRRTWTGPTGSPRCPVVPDPVTRLEDALRRERNDFLAARAHERLVVGDRLARSVPR